MLLAYTGKRSKDLKPIFPDVPSEMLVHPFSRSISRIHFKNDLFQYKRASEFLPDLIKEADSSLSWSECCAKRANDLLKLDCEYYYVSYSGGIDSTVALAAILDNWSGQDLKRLKIYLSHESIRENPVFFQKYVSHLPLISSFENISDKLIAENSLLITGELGDQLFGSDILATGSERFGQESLFGNYEEFVPRYLATFGMQLTPEEADKLFRRIQPIVLESPVPIRTTHDFFWWYNFSQKWQYVKFRYAEKAHWNLNARYGQHIVHFFDSVEFQKWSIRNHDLKLFGEWSNYKYAAKEYLFQFSGDSSQKRLLKVQSLKNNYMYTRKRVAIDGDYVELGYEDLGPHVRK